MYIKCTSWADPMLRKCYRIARFLQNDKQFYEYSFMLFSKRNSHKLVNNAWYNLSLSQRIFMVHINSHWCYSS